MNFDHPDLKARKLLMAAHLYYDRGISIMADAAYDELSREVADDIVLTNTGALPPDMAIDPVRIWQLGDPQDVRSSGMAFKFTWATIHGAESWYRSTTNMRPKPFSPRMRWSNKHKVSACAVTG